MFYGLLRDRWLVNQFQLLLSKVLISLEEFYGWLKSFFPDLKTGVTLANSISFFFFFWKTSSFIELRKILMRGFMICFIWFITLACILSKPGPLFVFNALHYMLPKTCSSLKGCHIVCIRFVDLRSFEICITFRNCWCKAWLKMLQV